MKILWVATKAPWPPRDGGRLLLWNTLRALAAAGHRIDLVAPIWDGSRESAEAEGQLAAWCTPHLVRARPRSAAATFLRSWISGEPWTLERHRLPLVGRAVTSLVGDQPCDVVVAEQLQALAQTDRLGRPGRPRSAARPLVLRSQNVESDLWAASAASVSDLRSAWLRAQARRLRRAEGAAVRSVDAVVALTARDAVALTALSGSTSVGAIPAPFESTLPAAEGALPGRPPLVLLGSPGWEPNEVQTRHFVRDIWPEVSTRVPGAKLHVFGGMVAVGGAGGAGAGGPGIDDHPAPRDSRDGFAPGSILVVPLAVASGVRMKILEAWARGVAVIASPAAAAGLESGSEAALAVAETPSQWASAVGELAEFPDVYAARAAAGREVLARWHSPEAVARGWTSLFNKLLDGPR